MAEREQAAQTRYQVSGYRPGIVGKEELRRNLISMVRRDQPWAGELQEVLTGAQFDMLQYFVGPERATRMMFRGSPEEREAGFREATGQQPFVVNVNVKAQLPDGRELDMPAEVDAAGIPGR
jgi:hypothetical protein